MSKLYDALNRAGGDTADIMKRIVGNDAPAQAPSPVSAPPAAAPAGSGITTSRLATEASESSGPAEIRTIRLNSQKPVLLFDDDHRKASEQYRIIRTKIVQHPLRPRVIVVSSGTPGDGKTFNSINLAGVLSFKDESRVLLVDGDLRRSSVALTLGIPNRPGLGEVLRGKATLRSAIVRVEGHPNLYVLPAGEPEDRPAELLDSPAWPAMLDIFRKRFTYVVVDAPPVAAVADYDLIQAPADGVIIVVRQDHTNRLAFARALEAVNKNKRLGVILNSAQDWWFARQSGYYYYGNYETYYVTEKPKADVDITPPKGLAGLLARFRRLRATKNK